MVDECARGAGLAVSSEEGNRNQQIDEAYVDFLSERISRLQAIAKGQPITAGFITESKSVNPQIESIAAVLKEWTKVTNCGEVVEVDLREPGKRIELWKGSLRYSLIRNAALGGGFENYVGIVRLYTVKANGLFQTEVEDGVLCVRPLKGGSTFALARRLIRENGLGQGGNRSQNAGRCAGGDQGGPQEFPSTRRPFCHRRVWLLKRTEWSGNKL